MKQKTEWIIGIRVAVIVGALGWLLMPGLSPGSPRNWGPVENGVRACVWIDSPNRTLGQPIHIGLALKNVSDQPVRVPIEIAFLGDITDHLSCDGKPHSDGMRGGERGPKSADDFVVLQPGEEYEFPFSAKEMILSAKRCREPGVYQYSFDVGFARSRDGEMKTIRGFRSNTVTFTLRRWGLLPF